jgi:hypothetical protein
VDEVSEYRRHAKRCRQLAAEIEGFEKRQLEHMAEEWEKRANDAEARLPDGSKKGPADKPGGAP